jgi:hypothetical protein
VGPPGNPGAIGRQGPTGPQGETGPQGNPGDSIFSVGYESFCGTTLIFTASTTLPLVTPSLYLSGSTISTINSCDDISLNVQGTSRIYLSADGNVGVGTTNPQNLLDVRNILEVYTEGISTTNYVNFGLTQGLTGYGLRETTGIMQYSNQSENWSPLNGVYIENITGPSFLQPYGLSIINSFNGSYNTTLPKSNLGAEKYVSLYLNTGFSQTINTNQGSFYLGPGLEYRKLTYTQNPYWNLEPGSFFTTGQQAELIGSPSTPTDGQGTSVALSADGNTLAVGAPNNNAGIGATWIFIRSGSTWTQQAQLVGIGTSGDSNQGASVALSGDGNTLAVGGPTDGLSSGPSGATWIFIRSGSAWTQQAKLVGAGYATTRRSTGQGYSVSLSVDGNTLATGDIDDNSQDGATWIFVRSSTVWTQQGNKLTQSQGGALEGYAESLSANGNILAVGAPGFSSSAGGVFIYYRYQGIWNLLQQITATGGVGTSSLGSSVSLSADGNILASGGPNDNSAIGATWIFNNYNGLYTQLGNKIVANGYTTPASQGISVSLSADGNTLYIGGPTDGPPTVSIGSVWTFVKVRENYQQQSQYTGQSTDMYFGYSVASSSLGDTLAVGAPTNNYGSTTGTGDNYIFT